MELDDFTADMFRQMPRIYFIGPKSCGKSTWMARLQVATWMTWNPHREVVVYFKFETFISIPTLPNQYFILFKDSLEFPCAKNRIPEAVQNVVDGLGPYECVLYDADRDVLYKPLFNAPNRFD